MKKSIFVGQDIGVQTLQIIDLQGRIVTETTLNEGNNQVNVESLPKGIYFANIKGTSSNEIHKLIVQ